MPSHVPYERARDSALPVAVSSSHAVKGGLVVKRATGQKAQPGPGSGSTGIWAASGLCPCPPPAQPLGAG